ncbi:MAG: flippase-like domain-containing protein, partial [Sphaerochaetaceae bacterium]|nr:flippase-like domain-containing protein [Sphaerochaetaceae bacterium]
VRVFDGFELYVLLRVLGLDEILLIQALFTMAMTSLVGNILFIIPMQLGAREGGAALALRWLGFEGSLGMTATLLARLREIFFTLLGVLIIQLNNKKEDE